MNLKIYLSIIMIIFILLIVFYLTKKYKLSKKQMLIFWILVLFWSSVSIIRAYRKLFALDNLDVGGLALSVNAAVQITSAYGLISFFLRFPLFLTSDYLNRKKLFIQLAMVFMIFSSIFVFVKPSFNSLYLSSLTMGICASMLAIFNVIFSETFSNDKASVSASILASAPLLAEFLAAPIQYLATYNVYKNYNYLWLFSAIISIITLYLTTYMHDFKLEKKILSINKLKNVISKKLFIYICIVALIQSFIKFSTSGANIIVYNKSINMPPIMLAYTDTFFALPQLLASILVGTLFNKYLKLEKILQIGIFTSSIFYLIVLYTNNNLIVLFSYIFNGFGYGLVYISLISISMQYFDKDYRNISMGVFQLFFSAGIFFGDSIYKWLNIYFPKGILNFAPNKTIFLIALALSMINIIFSEINIRIFKNI